MVCQLTFQVTAAELLKAATSFALQAHAVLTEPMENPSNTMLQLLELRFGLFSLTGKSSGLSFRVVYNALTQTDKLVHH